MTRQGVLRRRLGRTVGAIVLSLALGSTAAFGQAQPPSETGDLLTNATVNPQGLADLLNPQFLPGLDGFQVIDQRKLNVDGSRNPDYAKVVNFVQLPLPWGAETEAHHMQYEWEDGEPIIAGGLFNDTTFVLDASDIP